MADEEKDKKTQEAASRISGRLRNLENEINAGRSTPPDPNIAAQFDAIQRDLEALKSGQDVGEAEEKDEGDSHDAHSKAKKK